MTPYDAVVIGAGPAGASAAYHASRAGRSVLLLERHALPRAKPCGDIVSARAMAFIEDACVDALDAWAIETVRFVDASCYTAQSERIGEGRLWVVPRRQLDMRLVECAVGAGAQLRTAFVRGVRARDAWGACLVEYEEAGKRAVAFGRSLVVAAGHSPVSVDGRVQPRSRETTALACRAYARTNIRPSPREISIYVNLPALRGLPSYAWVCPYGDDRINVGVGAAELPVSRAALLRAFQALLHVLREREGVRIESMTAPQFGLIPFASSHSTMADGILCAGDAAGLACPLTAEGIASALASGSLAGKCIASNPEDAAEQYRALVSRGGEFHGASAEEVSERLLPRILATLTGRGCDVLTSGDSVVAGSLRNVILETAQVPPAMARERPLACTGRQRVELGLRQSLDRLPPIAREIAARHCLEGESRDRLLCAEGRVAELVVQAEQSGRESDVAALVALELAWLTLRLEADLSTGNEGRGWGHRALTMAIVDSINAICLEELYKLPQTVCDAVSRRIREATEAKLRAMLLRRHQPGAILSDVRAMLTKNLAALLGGSRREHRLVVDRA